MAARIIGCLKEGSGWNRCFKNKTNPRIFCGRRKEVTAEGRSRLPRSGGAFIDDAETFFGGSKESLLKLNQRLVLRNFGGGFDNIGINVDRILNNTKVCEIYIVRSCPSWGFIDFVEDFVIVILVLPVIILASVGIEAVTFNGPQNHGRGGGVAVLTRFAPRSRDGRLGFFLPRRGIRR